MKTTLHHAVQGYLLPTLQALLATQLLVRHPDSRSQHKIHAVQTGGYQSYCRGRGIDFDQVRPYQYGDDIRHIHWQAMAKSGHVYTKLFTEERERTIFLVVDYRASMQFGTRHTFKSVVAALLASRFAWEALERKDRIGAYIFSESFHVMVRPQGGKRGVLALLRALTDLRFTASSDSSLSLAQVLSQVRALIRPGSVLFILSDFMDSHDEDITRQLSQLAKHNQIVNLRIEDPLEKTPPKEGLYRFANQANQVLQLGLSLRSKKYGFWYQHVSAQLEMWNKRYAIPFECVSTQDIGKYDKQ
jgi:uncharacterized protein (DUF58 family)